MKDIHKINIQNENIDIKKIIFNLMKKINSTKYSKQLKTIELNKITLKTVRDHIDENYKNIFPSEVQYPSIHRDSQINPNRKVKLDLRDISNSNNIDSNKHISNNLKEEKSIRGLELTSKNNSKKNIDFSEKNDELLTGDDFTNKINELQNNREQFITENIKSNKQINELPNNLQQTLKF